MFFVEDYKTKKVLNVSSTFITFGHEFCTAPINDPDYPVAALLTRIQVQQCRIISYVLEI